MIQHHSYLNCTDLSSEFVLRAAHHGVNLFGRWSQWLGQGDRSSGGDRYAKSSYRQALGIAAGQAWPLSGGLHEPAFLTTGITTASEL